MSCWETSTFLPNPEIMEVSILKKACMSLGWEITEQNNIVTVLDANQGADLYGEYALQIKGNKVNYNDYYMNNGLEKITELQNAYMELYLPYLVNKIQDTFKNVGYKIKVNERFKATSTQYASFFVVASSKLKEEKDVEGKIKFTILRNGTVETDSNYIPPDIHELADHAMELLEKELNSEREITPKPRHLIPKHQRNKVHCKAKTKNTIKLKK